MKKIIILIISIFLIQVISHGQDCRNLSCNWKSILDLSTGMSTSGVLINPPGNDPYWKRTNFPQISGTCSNIYQLVFPKAFIINGLDVNWNNVTGAKILSAVNEHGFGCNNDDGNQPWVFRRTFGVCRDNSQIKITANLRADDEGKLYLRRPGNSEEYLMSSFLNSGYSNPSVADCWKTAEYEDTLTLNKGCYQLEFRLRNTNSISMGFALNCVLTDINNHNSLSNPSDSCCADGIIAVRKILDKDCSRNWSLGDLNGENWFFSLNNSNGDIVSTLTTNQWGEAVFTGLHSGTYTVSEELIQGWSNSQVSQTIHIGEGEGTLLTFYNCPDSVSTDLCCQIPNFNATLSGNNLDNLTLNLNSGTNQIQEVEVSMVDYHATYSEPGCQPVNMDASGGHIGYMTTTTSNLATLNLATAQNNSHVLDWLPGSPAQLNHTVNLSVKPPSVINVSCCSVNFSFCIKVRAKDVNCNVCEIDTCLMFTIGDTTIHESCCCEKWSREQIAVYHAMGSVGKPVIHQVNCGGNITLPPGEYTVSAPAFVCSPATCNATYQWTINRKGWEFSGHPNVTGTGNTLVYNFNEPGQYLVTFTPMCGSCKCEPCKIIIIIGPAQQCDCKGQGWIKDKPGAIIFQNNNIPIFCGESRSLDNPGTYQINAPLYLCNPANVNPTFLYNIFFNGNNVSSGPGGSFSYNFSQQGIYTIVITPNCCGNVCPPCTLKIEIKNPPPICDCGKWKLKKIQITSKPNQISKLVSCQTSVKLENTGFYNLIASDFVCIPDTCSDLYKWSVTGPVSGSGDGQSFGFNFSLPGQYMVTFTPYCGSYNVKCEPCTITLVIGSSKCKCKGWITHKVSINWKTPDLKSDMMDCPQEPPEPFTIDMVCKNTKVEGNFCTFVCEPKGCGVFYNWQVFYQDGQLVAEGIKSPSTHYEFIPPQKGIYTLWIQPICEGDVICDNICAVEVNIKQIKECR